VSGEECLAWFAYSNRSDRSELSTPDEDGTFVVKDLAAGSAVVLSSKRGEWLSTMKTIPCILITHPELFAQKLTPKFGGTWPGLQRFRLKTIMEPIESYITEFDMLSSCVGLKRL
jgi:hypothetical protein